VLDMSARSLAIGRWIGPTSISAHDGALYFGALGPFPIQPGADSIWKLTPSGQLSIVASGLTTVLGTAWDKRGRLYALESMTAPGLPGPGQVGAGKVVRIEPDGSQTTIADGLTFPTAMTFGPDRALYVSNLGLGTPPGAGQIVRITTG
jgi:sugar lactone lactonase YvrE